MNMKRLISLTLAAALLSCLSACGKPADTVVTDTTPGDTSAAESTAETPAEKTRIELDDPEYITWYGRVEKDGGAVRFCYTASGFEVRYRGSALEMVLMGESYSDPDRRVYVSVMTDGQTAAEVYELDKSSNKIKIELPEGEHSVKVLKRSEASMSGAELESLSVDGAFLPVTPRTDRFIEFYGDSITCGYGNLAPASTVGFSTKTENGLQTYAYLTSEALGADCSVLSGSGLAVCQSVFSNGVLIPDLISRASYYNSDAYISARVPQAVVVYGGINDLTYINSASDSDELKARRTAFIEAYTAMLNEITSRYPGVAVFCCCGMYAENNTLGTLIKKAIEGSDSPQSIHYVKLPTADRENGIGADGHPNAASHQSAAAALTEQLGKIMNW